MKRIEWNRVTWYSKLLAIILFIAVIPAWTFYIGTQYEKTKDLLNSNIVVKTVDSHNINISTNNLNQDNTLKTYTNTKYNIEFKYPKVWQEPVENPVKDEHLSDVYLSINFLGDIGIQAQFFPAASKKYLDEILNGQDGFNKTCTNQKQNIIINSLNAIRYNCDPVTFTAPDETKPETTQTTGVLILKKDGSALFVRYDRGYKITTYDSGFETIISSMKI